MKLRFSAVLMMLLFLFSKNAYTGENDFSGPKLILVSIDSLDPSVLKLNSLGEEGGKPEDWLLPNIREFLEASVWFENARCWLPAATDMNHLNAIAGTTSALTGIIGVSQQFSHWDKDGNAVYQNTSMSFARDDKGRPVDTIFKAFKRKYPSTKILFSSGKGWVAAMFDEPDSGIDFFVTGLNHPEYVDDPWPWNFNSKDPRDARGYCARKSYYQKGFMRIAYKKHYDRFPPDSWVTAATLTVMKKEQPDVSMVILAEMDDLQHALGSVRNPEEFEKGCCVVKNKRNPNIHKAPVIAAMRLVDDDFGKFIKGIREIPGYADAIIVMYSDHGHMSYTETVDSNLCPSMNTDPKEILYRYRAITKDEYKGKGFSVNSIASVGEVYFYSDNLDTRRAKATQAKMALEAYRIKNPVTKQHECPWTVLNIEEMRYGTSSISARGELYHHYFADMNDKEGSRWPDLFIFMKNGWQLPVTTGIANNLGAKLPSWLPPLNYLLGGHGSEDTVPIVMAFQGGGIQGGKIVPDPEYKENFRISDIAMTVASVYGLELKSTSVGIDRKALLGITDLKAADAQTKQEQAPTSEPVKAAP